MDPDRIARLTEGQRQCLRLVLQHRSSKEIAIDLGISPHTVDMRLKMAMQILNVPSRVAAAQALAANEADEPYQRLVYQPPAIADVAESDILSPFGKRNASTGSDDGDGVTRRWRWGHSSDRTARKASITTAVPIEGGGTQ